MVANHFQAFTNTFMSNQSYNKCKYLAVNFKPSQIIQCKWSKINQGSSCFKGEFSFYPMLRHDLIMSLEELFKDLAIGCLLKIVKRQKKGKGKQQTCKRQKQKTKKQIEKIMCSSIKGRITSCYVSFVKQNPNLWKGFIYILVF